MKKSQSKPSDAGAKLSHREFIERSIKALRKAPYKGIHLVYSGFNSAFRQYYDEDPRPVIDKMVAEGFLVLRIAKGGAIVMLASDAGEEKKSEDSSSAVLAKILTQRD